MIGIIAFLTGEHFAAAVVYTTKTALRLPARSMASGSSRRAAERRS
jgi:hypothetical protein